MNCRIPYENLKTLFIKSLAFDREKYRHYRYSIESIMSSNLKDEAKVHAIWFMGILYNNALNLESELEENGIVTEGLPIKIADLVKEELNNPGADYTALLKGIREIVNSVEVDPTQIIKVVEPSVQPVVEPIVEPAKPVPSTKPKQGNLYEQLRDKNISIASKGFVAYYIARDGSTKPDVRRLGVVMVVSQRGFKYKKEDGTLSDWFNYSYTKVRGGGMGNPYYMFSPTELVQEKTVAPAPIKEEKKLTTIQKIDNILQKALTANDTTVSNLLSELEKVLDADVLYDSAARIKAYNKFLQSISKIKGTNAVSVRALTQEKINQYDDLSKKQASFINVRELSVFKDLNYVRKDNGAILLVVYKDGKYYNYNESFDGTNFEVLTEYTVEPKDYISQFYKDENLAVTNSTGSEFRLNSTLSKNGVSFEGVRIFETAPAKGEVGVKDTRPGNQKISDNLAAGVGLNKQLKFIADRRRIQANKYRVELLNQSGYDIRFENSLTPNQTNYLLTHPDKPVVTRLHNKAGIDIIVSLQDDSAWDYIFSLDSLGFVYADGTSRFIDWESEEDLKLFADATKLKAYGQYKVDPNNPRQDYDYVKPSTKDIQNLKEAVLNIKRLKAAVLDLMEEGQETLEIPSDLISEFLDISNVFTSFTPMSKQEEGVNTVYKAVETLESFKDTLIPTNSVIPVRIAQVSAGQVITSTIREELLVGVIKRDPILGFSFEPSIEKGYQIIDSNNNVVSYEEVFKQNGLDTQQITDTLSHPSISKYGFFFLYKTKERWNVQPMHKSSRITSPSEIVNFASVLGALQKLKPEFNTENLEKINELVRVFNNKGWGFNEYKGLIANVNFLNFWNNEPVYGIQFRATPEYKYSEEFNEKKLNIEFSFDYDVIEQNLRVLYKELNINPNEYQSSIENRIRLGNVLEDKIAENQHLLTPAAKKAIENIQNEYNLAVINVNKQLNTILNKHNEAAAKKESARFLDSEKDLRFLLFGTASGQDFKLGSRTKKQNPLANFKVFENNLKNSRKELVVVSAKPSLGFAATVKTSTASSSVKKESANSTAVQSETKEVVIKTKKLFSIASALDNLKFVSTEKLQKEIDDVRRMAGSTLEDISYVEQGRSEMGYVLGYYEDNVITLNKLLPVGGVVYHELFHHIFRMSLSTEERLKYLQAARTILGSYKTDAKGKYINVRGEKIYLDEFRKRRNYAGVEDDIILDYIYEEYLADGFRDYKLNKAEPKSKLIRVLYSLLDKIINLFKSRAYKDAKNAITNLYGNIDSGNYADVIGDKYQAPRAYDLCSVPTVVTKDGQMDYKQVDNYTVDQLVDRITREILKRAGDINKRNPKTFDKVYDEVTFELINYFNVKNFITEDNPNAAQIIATYGPMFRTMRFLMGAAHRPEINEAFILDNVSSDPKLNDFSFSSVKGSLEFSYEQYSNIKQQVKNAFDKIGVIREDVVSSEEDEISREESSENLEDDYIERTDENEVGERFDDNGILTYKPYEGSVEFQRLIKYIKYEFRDEKLGISFDKMVNSREVINAIRKICYNTPKEYLVSAIYNHIEYLRNNIENFERSGLKESLGYIPVDMVQTIDDYYTLKAVYDTLDEQAALSDNFLPTRELGKPFYNMFLNVFYRANKNIVSTSIGTSYENVTLEERESLDRAPIKNRYTTNSLVEKSNLAIVLNNFRTNLNVGIESLTLKNNIYKYRVLLESLRNFNYIIPTSQEKFDNMVNIIYQLTSYGNLNISRNIIEFAVAASVKEAYGDKAAFVDNIITPNQKFFDAGQYFDIQAFVDGYLGVLNGLAKSSNVFQQAVNTFVLEYKKIAPFQIKYDPTLSSVTILNQDGKPISQSIPYVPSVQILNEIKWKGLNQTLLKYYGSLDFFTNNSMLAPIVSGSQYDPNVKTPESIEEDTLRVFFDKLDISVAGGMFQSFKGQRRQSAFKGLGDKGYALSVLGLFANRVSVTGNYGQEIIFFERPITQLEATSTQFNITGLYYDYNQKGAKKKIQSNLKGILKQEFERIGREWSSRDEYKLRHENYNCETSSDATVITDNLKLRAYNFNIIKDFFDTDEIVSFTTEEDDTIANLHNILRQAALNNQGFEYTLSQPYYDTTGNKTEYTVDAVLSAALYDYAQDQLNGLIEYFESIDVTLDDLPSSISLNGERTTLTKYTKETSEEKGDEFIRKSTETAVNKNKFLTDFAYNYWFNSMMMNQLFDGDLAVGIGSIVNFFKRQKSGVISGNNYRNVNIAEEDDNTVFAVIKTLEGYLSDDPSVPVTTDPEVGGDKTIKFADGQAFSGIDRRIKKFDKDGILSPRLKEILKKLRYSRLTSAEILELNDNGIFLGSDKPAVGHPMYYYKDSEHYINRLDHSYVDDPKRVAELYEQLDALNMDSHSINDDVIAQHKALIKEIHSHFKPKRGRSFGHHLLNALEYHRVDVVFDEETSKRATVNPLVINLNLVDSDMLEGHGDMVIGKHRRPIIEDGYINLAYSRHGVSNNLVYEQVSTKGIAAKTTDSIQKKLLLPAQLDPKEFPGVQKILDLQNEIVKSRLQLLQRVFNVEDPKTLITKAIQAGLMKQGAGENLLKFFSLDSTGKNKFNLNLPILGKMPMFYFFSVFNNSLFGPKIPGKKFYHVSGAGYKIVVDENDNPINRRELDANPKKYEGYKTRYPTVKEVRDDKGALKEIVIEVIIPRELASTKQDVEFFERLYTDFLAARIPTADKRSMVRAKVVDYIDASYGNSIIVPPQVHVWAGSDLDIDSLYAETYAYYRNTLGKLVKYGDYTSYTKLGLSEKDSKFIEFLHYMATDSVLSDLVDSEEDRLQQDEEYKTRSLANATGLFGKEIEEFFSRTEAEILQLLSPEIFNELKKGKDVTLSIATTSNTSGKKAKGLESLGQLMNANIVSSNKNLGNILKLMDRLVAVVNVLNRYNLPSNPNELVAFSNTEGNPVHSVLHNSILKEKMDILADPKVYERFLKNSDGEKYINDYSADKKLVEDVSEYKPLNKMNAYAFQTVATSRSIVGSAMDSVSANANQIKAATLIATSNIKLSKDFTFNFAYNGKAIKTNAPVNDSVQLIGGATDVSVDDAKHQNLAPLRISRLNASAIGAMYIYGYPAQFARLINSVDLIANSIKEFRLQDDPSYSRSVSFKMGFSTFLNNKVSQLVNLNVGAFSKLGITKPSINKINKYEIDHKLVTIEFKDVTSKLQKEKNKPSDFNIIVKNAKGEVLSDALASIVLLSFYNEFAKVGSALAFKISKVTDVNKKIRPAFRTLSSIKSAVDFIYDNPIFENAPNIFKTYPYLKKLAEDSISMMTNKSKEVLLDETNLFKAITSMFRYDKSTNIEEIVLQLKSVLGLSALSAYVAREMQNIDLNNMSPKDIFVKAIYEATTTDYWKSNKIEKDLDYLKLRYPNNDFLKSITTKPLMYDGTGKIKVITSLISSKLSIEAQNKIINDFYELLSSSDPSIYDMAINVAVHGIIKDGGISKSEGFLKIIAPELFTYMSNQLNIIQDKLYDIDMTKGNTVSKYLASIDNMFNDIYNLEPVKGTKKGLYSQVAVDFILTKLVSIVTQNTEGDPTLRLSFFKGNDKYLPGKFSDISLKLFTSIIDTILPDNASEIYIRTVNSAGKTTIKPINLGLNEGLRKSSTTFELWKANSKNEIFFDLSQIDDTNREVVSRLLLPQGIYLTRDGNYSFPLYQVNNFKDGQVFLLTELNGVPFTSEFFKNLFESHKSEDGFQFLLRGMTAKYKVIDKQGIGRISPNAFSNTVAEEIRNAALKTSTKEYAVKQIIPTLPEKVKVLSGSSYLYIGNKKYLDQVLNTTHAYENLNLSISSEAIRYSVSKSAKGKVFMNGRALTSEQLNEFANRLGYSNFEEATKNPKFTSWMNPESSFNEFWLVPYTSEVVFDEDSTIVTEETEIENFEIIEKGFKLSIDKKGKDQGKANLANALIAYANPNTSSHQYLEDAKKQGVPTNQEIIAGPGVVAMVSVNGNNKATDKQIEDTYLQAREIIESGGTIIMDSTADANRSWNQTGEAVVQQELGQPSGQTSKGYNYWGPNPETSKEVTVRLRDAKVYSASQLSTGMLEEMGYTPNEIGEILNRLCL